MNKEEHYKQVITDVVEGRARIQGNHPKEVKDAMDAFFHAGKMLIDTPELEYIPSEYVSNLIKAMSNYPAYQGLALDLVKIINQYK